MTLIFHQRLNERRVPDLIAAGKAAGPKPETTGCEQEAQSQVPHQLLSGACVRQNRRPSLPRPACAISCKNIDELILDCSWLNELGESIVRHGISLLQREKRRLKSPHDMLPYRFTHSPILAIARSTTPKAILRYNDPAP